MKFREYQLRPRVSCGITTFKWKSFGTLVWSEVPSRQVALDQINRDADKHHADVVRVHEEAEHAC